MGLFTYIVNSFIMTDNLIGKGGCAEVYKGCLPDGRFIAVKRMNKGSLEDREGNFLSEVGTIAHVDHPNTAKMIGYGVEGGAYLVLKLSSNGSLGSLLRGLSQNVFSQGFHTCLFQW